RHEGRVRAGRSHADAGKRYRVARALRGARDGALAPARRAFRDHVVAVDHEGDLRVRRVADERHAELELDGVVAAYLEVHVLEDDAAGADVAGEGPAVGAERRAADDVIGIDAEP